MEREKIFETFLGGILIVLLLIMILLFTNSNETNNSTLIISDSYNTNSYNNYDTNSISDYKKINSDYKPIYKKYEKKKLQYRDKGKYYQVKGLFGNDINKYDVYVKNREYTGGYFTVEFYFKDKYGNAKKQKETRYIKSHENKKFSYQKVYDDETHYWKHNVISHSKIKK